jgi:hypothetical protein
MNFNRLNLKSLSPLFFLLLLPGNPDIAKNTNSPGQPEMVHLSLAEKKSGKTASPVTATWCSAVKEGSQYVRYGLTPDLNMTSRAEKRKFNKELIMTALLKHLKYNLKYFYKCGSDAAGWSNIAKWKESLLPLLEKYKVDLCLAGHRHVYERHFQLDKGIPVQNESGTTFTAGKGTIFITNGTAGGNPTGTGGKDLRTMAFTPDDRIYSFAIIDISNESITYRVFNQDNILIDWFTIEKE